MDVKPVNEDNLRIVLKDLYDNNDEESDFLIDPESPFLQVIENCFEPG